MLAICHHSLQDVIVSAMASLQETGWQSLDLVTMNASGPSRIFPVLLLDVDLPH